MSNCIFCQIAAKTIPAKILYEDNNLFVIKDIKPVAPVHVLIIPKQHLSWIDIEKKLPDLPNQVMAVANKLVSQLEIAQSGFRIINNYGPDSGQEIDHIHWHLLGGKRLGPIG